MQFIDTNIILRFLTGDDPTKFEACKALFEQIETGTISVFVPDVVIAEVVYMLSSPKTYNHSRQEVAELLTPLLHLSRFEVQNRHILLRALRIYADNKELDFPDAYIASAMEQTKNKQLFSYDHDFDDFPFITREEPKPLVKAA
jgi:predicted nucleic acid-binding protein